VKANNHPRRFSGDLSCQSNHALKLVVADDHTIVRQAVTAILNEEEDFAIAGEACDGHAAVRLCAALHPDVAILDITMPMLNGVDCAREIFRVCPRTKIVVLTMHSEEQFVQASLRAGISGYVMKSETASALAEAVRAVSRGETYLSPIVARTMARGLPESVRRASPLGLREREVLQLIAEGKSMKEIGFMLGISNRTAQAHRFRIMRKLNASDGAGLLQAAVREGLFGFVQ
jgi:DNA-binding NarL/FixJ family response regulator